MLPSLEPDLGYRLYKTPYSKHYQPVINGKVIRRNFRRATDAEAHSRVLWARYQRLKACHA